MSKTRTAARGSVIVVSVVLAGAFVYYRGMQGRSIVGEITIPAAGQQQQSAAPQPIISGTKSAEMFTGHDASDLYIRDTGHTDAGERMLLSGSKSRQVLSPGEFGIAGAAPVEHNGEPASQPATQPSSVEGP